MKIVPKPELASTPELVRLYGVHKFAITRWVRRGCPVRREKPYIFDLNQVEAWRREQGMTPVENDECAQ